MLTFVTGATGQQGGAVAARLLADGGRVRALTRNPSGPKARTLAATGAEIVTGGLGDPLDEHVRGADTVLFVHPGPLAPDEDEAAAAQAVAQAAAAHGIQHLVYSSGLGALGPKADAEKHIRRSGVSATILRPASFMENYLNPVFGLRDGALRSALEPDTVQDVIALDDIAAFAALAFADPAMFAARTIDLAGDSLRTPQIAAAISVTVGQTVPYEQMPIEELAKINERFAAGCRMLNKIKAPTVDVAAVRALHPGLIDFGRWLERTGARRITEILRG